MLLQEPTTVTGIPNVWAFAIACVTAVTTIATAIITIVLNRKADSIHVLVNSNLDRVKALVRLYRAQLIAAGIKPDQLKEMLSEIEQEDFDSPNPKAQ